MGLLGAIGGGLVSSAMGLIGQNAQNQFNSSQVQSQEQFQDQMSSTAYQRAVKDMTAAGLNPGSMFGSGGPSSTPMGGAAQSGNSLANNTIGSAYQAGQQLENDTNVAKAQVIKTLADAKKVGVDTRTSSAQAKVAEAQAPGKVQISDVASEAASSAGGLWDWLKSGSLGSKVGDWFYGGPPVSDQDRSAAQSERGY